MELDILFVNKERSFNEIAIVFVRYHEVVLRCKLVVSVNQKRELFYYLLMPFINSKEKVKGQNKPTRINVVNWPNEQISKSFQKKALEILRSRHPDLFNQCVEEVEEYLEKRQESIQKKKEKKAVSPAKKRTSRSRGACKHVC